jgi:signal transduction histidine kinase
MLDSLGAAFQRQLRLTADASHELRTPVTVVLSQAEQTLFRDRSPEEYRAALETCLRSARRMKRLIDDLLLLARADSGRLELQLQRIDLAEVARQAVAMLEPIAAQHEIRLSSQLQSTMLRGDSLRLGQVAANLVNNAIVYNRPGGTVFVSVSLRADSAVLTVSDTGIGIAAEDRERMFERFYRADPARTHEPSQGAGLGLSIVQEIVAAHSGVLEVTSEPGAGTTMAVVLPTAGPGETGPRGSELIHE